MNESEALSGLVGHIYDAAIDPGFWPDALRETARFVGGCSAAIYSKDPTSHSGGVLYDDGGLSLHYRTLYFERYVQLDPATTRHFFTEIGELVATIDIMPHAEFEQSRFYREWVRPQQLVDFVSTVLDRSGTSASMFGVFRHERDGVVDEAMRQRMHLVVPHIRRAALIGRALEQHSARAEVLASSLDTIRAGMFLVGASGALVHANAAGHGLLLPGGPLRIAAGRLITTDAALEQCLRDAAATGEVVMRCWESAASPCPSPAKAARRWSPMCCLSIQASGGKCVPAPPLSRRCSCSGPSSTSRRRPRR